MHDDDELSRVLLCGNDRDLCETLVREETPYPITGIRIDVYTFLDYPWRKILLPFLMFSHISTVKTTYVPGYTKLRVEDVLFFPPVLLIQ